MHLLDLPALFIGGWFDPFLERMIVDYERLMKAPEGSKSRDSRLIMGPWLHVPIDTFKELNIPRMPPLNMNCNRSLFGAMRG